MDEYDRAVTVDDARRHLADVVAAVERRHDRIAVTRDGRVAAVLVSPDALAALDDTLDVLADPAALGAIGRSEEALAASGGTDAAGLLAAFAAP